MLKISLNKPKIDLTTALKILFAVERRGGVSLGEFEKYGEETVVACFLVFSIWTEFVRSLCVSPCDFFYRLPLSLFSPKQM